MCDKQNKQTKKVCVCVCVCVCVWLKVEPCTARTRRRLVQWLQLCPDKAKLRERDQQPVQLIAECDTDCEAQLVAKDFELTLRRVAGGAGWCFLPGCW